MSGFCTRWEHFCSPCGANTMNGRNLLLLAFVGVLLCEQVFATVWYVDKDNLSGTENGQSWATAYKEIQPAINAAAANDEVWVADGAYTAVDDPVVVMKNYVPLYGGFSGVETVRNQRDWLNHVTAIDGENARRCVNGASNTALDGFSVLRGAAPRGGGMYNLSVIGSVVANCLFSSNTAGDYLGGGAGMRNENAATLEVSKCTFSNNVDNTAFGGGGVQNWGCPQSVVISDCIFDANRATESGAGIRNDSSSVLITRCLFMNNAADSAGGGLVNATASQSTVTNCIFAGNSAYFTGGLGCAENSSCFVANCTFYANTAVSVGGAIGSDLNSPQTVVNCILWHDSPVEIEGPVTVTFSSVEGGFPGQGNTEADPLLMSPASNDFRLQAASPCIDTGTASGAPSTDFAGNPRPVDVPGVGGPGLTYDMGANEFGSPPACEPVDGCASGDISCSRGEDLCLAVPCPVSPASTYDWSKGEESLEPNGRISGVFERALRISDAQAADSGTYTCSYDDGSKSPAQFQAVVTVNAATPAVGFPGIVAMVVLLTFIGGVICTKRVLTVLTLVVCAVCVEANAQLGTTWSDATASAAWPARHHHCSVVLNDKVWLFAGRENENDQSVWWSQDGATWNLATATAQWTPRTMSGAASHAGRMWLIAGTRGWYGVSTNDVWSSDDGTQWTQTTSAAPWVARCAFPAVAHNGKIWIMGGADRNPPSLLFNDVWNSEDGVHWNLVTSSTGWTPRWAHAAVSYAGRIWVIGGDDGYFTCKNDVWYSEDGVIWTEATNAAAWSARSFHSCAVWGGDMWVLGGGIDGLYTNDVWRSSDGASWTCATSAAGWSPRYAHTSVVLNGNLWLLGGAPWVGAVFNDVWISQGSPLPCEPVDGCVSEDITCSRGADLCLAVPCPVSSTSTYDWSKGEESLELNGRISGVFERALRISDAQVAD